MKTKREVRIYIGTLFGENILSDNEYDLTEKLLSYIEKNNMYSICIYESMNDEVNTEDIITKLLRSGKNIYIPEIISDTEMKLIDCISKEDYIGNIDIFIVPGRAFTREGKRIGRGKGYYDRFLSQQQYTNSKKVGICYDFQILEDIPTEEHDIDMDYIISQ